MAAAGAAFAAPAGVRLCAAMDAWWPAASAGARAPALATGKFVLDQAVGCAIWQAAYCSLPGNEAYRDALLGFFGAAASAAAAGARDAAAFGAATLAAVVPAPAVAA